MTKPKAPVSSADFWRNAYELARDLHAIEVRTLQGRIDDLRDRLSALGAGGRPLLSGETVDAYIARRKAEEGTEETEGKESENPLRKSDPVQWIIDSVEEEIPLSNQNARDNLTKWVRRQVRLRGQGSLDEILNEALAGDVSEEGEEE